METLQLMRCSEKQLEQVVNYLTVIAFLVLFQLKEQYKYFSETFCSNEQLNIKSILLCNIINSKTYNTILNNNTAPNIKQSIEKCYIFGFILCPLPKLVFIILFVLFRCIPRFHITLSLNHEKKT